MFLGIFSFLLGGMNREQASSNCQGANCSKSSTNCSNTSSGCKTTNSANSPCSGGQCSTNKRALYTRPGINCENGDCNIS